MKKLKEVLLYFAIGFILLLAEIEYLFKKM